MPRKMILAGFIALSLVCGQSVGLAAAQTSPDPAMAAARELIATMRLAEQMKLILPPMVQAMRLAVVQGRPEVDRDFDAILPALLERASARIDEWLDQMAVIYSRNFTPDEMRQVTAFYRSPAGQTFLERMPTIMQESIQLGQTFDVTGELQKRMIEELRKKGHSL